MADNKHIVYTEELITPQIAHSYLAVNHPNNRSLVKAKVDAYARDIQAGKWRLTHQGIAFDNKGRLIDGQHRLSAIIRAGRAAPMMVARYADNASLAVLDQGRNRTVHDAMMITYGRGRALHTTVIAFIRSFNQQILGGAYNLSVQELMQWSDRYPQIIRLVKTLQSASASRNSSAVTVACVCACINGVKTDAVIAFCKCLYANEINTTYNCKAALDCADTIRGRVRLTAPAQRTNLLQIVKNGLYLFLSGKSYLKDRTIDRYPVTIEQVENYKYEGG